METEIAGAFQQEIQEQEPLPADEPEEERQRLISVGIMDMDKRLGGGLPPNTLTLVEGDPDAGKSVLIQQLTFGALKEGFRVSFFLSELTTRDFLNQMESLGMSTTDYFLIRRLTLYHGQPEGGPGEGGMDPSAPPPPHRAVRQARPLRCGLHHPPPFPVR